jgi:quercetin dioxygenase-like cupin family protein
MRWISSITIITTLVLAAGFGIAQPRTGRPGPGFHAVTLPAAAPAGASTEPNVLLETAHLKLVSIRVPKGGVLPAHSAQTQVSVQALSGAGEVKIGDTLMRIDAAHMVVLAPGITHEVRASAERDLVLLIHHVGAGPRGRGPMR